MMMRPAQRMISVTVLAVGLSVGCGPSTRAVFHPSDPGFVPKPGANPPVYLERNLAEVPHQPMRSVGLIEVTVPETSGIDRAIEVAAEKGRDLGCWILIEHAAFASVRSRASLEHDASVILAHGGADMHRPVMAPGKLTAKFDCVLPASAARTARTLSHQ